jgi:hypothetical protein
MFIPLKANVWNRSKTPIKRYAIPRNVKDVFSEISLEFQASINTAQAVPMLTISASE